MEDNIFDQIKEVDLKKTMEENYIDYAMSVIAARALPDVRKRAGCDYAHRIVDVVFLHRLFQVNLFDLVKNVVFQGLILLYFF